ncbi:MAG: ATP-binding protein [Bacteroidota bacterium]|nr:ATP-binding protein [Bacteroidota bacterium]
MAYQTFKNKLKKRPLRIIYLLYWFLLAYILAALVFWFIVLNKQNMELSHYKLDMIDVDDSLHIQKVENIATEKSKKTAQYFGEGITFLLLISFGAVVVFKVINKQLVQSQQQQNFMMAITHELKTPIAVTKLNLETMQKRTLGYEQQQKLIRTTIQEADRLNSLCNNMLLLSQIDSGEYSFTKEQFDLGILADECAEDFMIRFPHRNIEIYLDEETIIAGDRLLLQLAVNNLLDNAIKYSGKEDVILLKVFKENKWVKLQVIDEGPGISVEEKSKIFEKYFRGAQRRTKGTGLGLYLTKEIVKQHHGDITMINNIPRGCIFEIRLKYPKN